jgi:hypothetical protein
MLYFLRLFTVEPIFSGMHDDPLGSAVSCLSSTIRAFTKNDDTACSCDIVNADELETEACVIEGLSTVPVQGAAFCSLL